MATGWGDTLFVFFPAFGLNLGKFNLRSGVLFSEEGERKATRDYAVIRSVRLLSGEKKFAFLHKKNA